MFLCPYDITSQYYTQGQENVVNGMVMDVFVGGEGGGEGSHEVNYCVNSMYVYSHRLLQNRVI